MDEPSKQAVRLPMPWPHGSTILRRQCLIVQPTRRTLLWRKVQTRVGYALIACLPVTAWLVPPPPHAQHGVTDRRVELRTAAASSIAADGAIDPETEYGRQLYLQSCAACHGTEGQGLPHQGAAISTSAFLAGSSDASLLTFLRQGRQPDDPQSKFKLLMPPRGNPPLRDAELQRLVPYLRQLNSFPSPAAGGP